MVFFRSEELASWRTCQWWGGEGGLTCNKRLTLTFFRKQVAPCTGARSTTQTADAKPITTSDAFPRVRRRTCNKRPAGDHLNDNDSSTRSRSSISKGSRLNEAPWFCGNMGRMAAGRRELVRATIPRGRTSILSLTLIALGANLLSGRSPSVNGEPPQQFFLLHALRAEVENRGFVDQRANQRNASSPQRHRSEESRF